MSKRRLRFGIEALMVLGVAASLLWVGGSMGGSLLANAQDVGTTGDVEVAEDVEVDGQIPAGYDAWSTQNDGSTKLSIDLPPGFFCNGLSSATTQLVKFKGVPFTTDPAGEAGEADTLIERLDPANFVDGAATTRIRIVGLSLESAAPIKITCPNGTQESWTARVTVDPSTPAPIGTMTIRENAAGTGGTFDSSFDVPGRITFHGPGGAVAGPLFHTAHLSNQGAPWARIVATKVWKCRVGYWIDLDGDGIWDLYIELWRCPGRGGFHPGWVPNPIPGQPGTPGDWDHSAPHPEVWPVCVPSCRPPVIIGGGTASGSGSGTSTVVVGASATGVVGN